MKKHLILWELAGFLWTAAAGTLLHFVYGWSGRRLWAAVVGAVNESVWEHMKLLYVPLLLFTVAQWTCMGREKVPGLLFVRSRTALLGVGLIPVLYYTYTGALGTESTAVNVGIFFAAAAAAFWVDGKLLRRGGKNTCGQRMLGAAVLLVLALLFVCWTFVPPKLPLWQDPVTGGYGLALDPVRKTQYN